MIAQIILHTHHIFRGLSSSRPDLLDAPPPILSIFIDSTAPATQNGVSNASRNKMPEAARPAAYASAANRFCGAGPGSASASLSLTSATSSCPRRALAP